MKENICRLCLQTTENNQPLGQSLKDTLILNMNISKEPVKCIECTNNLELFLKFKSACVYVESKSESKCCFCTKMSGRQSLTSINESKEYTFLLDKLREHIPKLNLNMTEELLTCETCLDELQNVFSFVMKCLNVEQQVNKYTEIKGIDDKVQIELRDVQQFLSKQTIKCEIESKPVERCGHFQEEHTMQTESEMKHEEEIENPEIFMKTEDIDIKSEQDNCDRFQDSTSFAEIENGSLGMTVHKSQDKHKKGIKQQDLIYKNRGRGTVYKCETCQYETKYKNYFKRHKLTHKSNSVVPMFKCELCPYETKHQGFIKRHKLTHKSASEITILKCDLCPYETKCRFNLNRHNLSHKNSSEVTMFKCELCPYETKYHDELKRHKLRYKSASEVTMLKCELCPYKTRYWRYLQQHKFVHKSTSEVTMFKCDQCSYETKYRRYIKRHKLTHECSSEVTMFKCDLCPYETKHQYYMKRHKSAHKSASGITV